MLLSRVVFVRSNPNTSFYPPTVEKLLNLSFVQHRSMRHVRCTYGSWKESGLTPTHPIMQKQNGYEIVRYGLGYDVMGVLPMILVVSNSIRKIETIKDMLTNLANAKTKKHQHKSIPKFFSKHTLPHHVYRIDAYP